MINLHCNNFKHYFERYHCKYHKSSPAEVTVTLLVFLCHPQDLEVVTRFLPAMMSVVVDDHTFTVEQKLPSEEKSSLSYPTTLPESFNR